MTGRPVNQDRQNALALDLPTYEGNVCRKCETTTRYTKSCGCVQCARDTASAQRQALKDKINQEQRAADGPLDDDAATRYEAGIEDLM